MSAAYSSRTEASHKPGVDGRGAEAGDGRAGVACQRATQLAYRMLKRTERRVAR